jgi:colanic acid/amylovoran biosynthesis glycosyltransferase
MSTDRSLVIWRSAMLSASETFVRNHGESLTRWRPTYVGATKVESTLSRATDLITYRDPADRAAFMRLRLTGRSRRLQRLLAAARPRLVHAHFGGDGWLVSDSAARLGVPLIVTVHGHDVTRQPQTPGAKGVRYRRNLKAVFDRAAVIIAVSEVIRQKAIHWGADPAKVRVHYTGVPIPAAVPDRPKDWDVTFVGRFVEKKGADDLVAALAELRPARPRALFIGDGPLLEQVRARAAQLGLDAWFRGALPPAEVYPLLAASRMLAAPSRTAADGDTEGLPTTIVEAAAMGLPVVATRHSGIPEAVLDGETGLLSPEGDRSALAANLRRLLDDADLRDRLGKQARENALANFDLAVQSRRLELLYDELTTTP